MAKWLGLDIGGANIKVADSNRFALSRPFPLWKYPDRLHLAIGELIHSAPEFDALAVTMTGELCDCYQTREEGVCRILEQLTSIVPSPLVRVYSTSGEWLAVNQAARHPWTVAASNWHALATYALRWVGEAAGLLIDVGSTTCDLIPLKQGAIATEATTDSQRLVAGQLIYTGVERTPVCSIVRSLPLRGQSCPVMNELFATVRDAYLWIGELSEDTECCDTADGKPATRSGAAFRLARMVGEDGASLGEQEMDDIADTIAEAQANLIARAIANQRTLLGDSECGQIIVSGHGDFLVDEALRILNWKPQRISVKELLGPMLSRCAPAFAVATLATEQKIEPLLDLT